MGKLGLDRPRIAILGAGPVALDAALAASDAGFPFTVYEAGDHPGSNVRSWGHVRLFSPWSMNVSRRMQEQLERSGSPLRVDQGSFPTGHEYADEVLDPLWYGSSVAQSLRLGTRVLGVGREGLLKDEKIGSAERRRHAFRILLADSSGAERVESADVVLDCTGKYGHPNTLGDGGIPAPGELAHADRIERRIPDFEKECHEWSGRTILLAGSGHSAQTAAAELARLTTSDEGTRVLWVVRKKAPALPAVDDDPLPGRRALVGVASELLAGGSSLIEPVRGSVVHAVEAENGHLRVLLRQAEGSERWVQVDRVLSLTGGVGDHSIYRQLQVHECYATSGPMKLAAALLAEAGGDCLDQASHGLETLRHPEPNFFVLGEKSYGRNNTFLLRVGWQQVDEVFTELARTS